MKMFNGFEKETKNSFVGDQDEMQFHNERKNLRN